MKLTGQEEYGLRCLLQIGRRGLGGALTIPEISEAEGISVHYVAKLLRILRQAGFVKSTRGKVGGYCLARPADRILVGEVLDMLGGRLFEESFCEDHAGQTRTCMHSVDCSIRVLWKTLQGALDRVLNKTTLQDLLRTETEMSTWLTTLPVFKPEESVVRPPAA